MKNFKSSIVKWVKEHCPFTKNNSKQNNGSEYVKSGFYYDFSPIDVCVDEDKSSYEEEFNQIKYALENDKVKNLAILVSLVLVRVVLYLHFSSMNKSIIK